MIHHAPSILVPWTNFYVMTGSAAASLTGLMFVVISLVSGERRRRNPTGISTFSTPTVAHFGAVLLISAILCAPWHSLGYPTALLGIGGLGGIAYVLRIMHLTRKLTSYTADLEDWTWYTALPFVGYGSMFAGAILLYTVPVHALYAVGAGLMCLIFAGIHNAWDIVTYVATGTGDSDT